MVTTSERKVPNNTCSIHSIFKSITGKLKLNSKIGQLNKQILKKIIWVHVMLWRHVTDLFSYEIQQSVKATSSSLKQTSTGQVAGHMSRGARWPGEPTGVWRGYSWRQKLGRGTIPGRGVLEWEPGSKMGRNKYQWMPSMRANLVSRWEPGHRIVSDQMSERWASRVKAGCETGWAAGVDLGNPRKKDQVT